MKNELQLETKSPPLFVWRGTFDCYIDMSRWEQSLSLLNISSGCPYCSGQYLKDRSAWRHACGLEFESTRFECSVCGFWYSDYRSKFKRTRASAFYVVDPNDEIELTVSRLLRFTINDANVALDELGSHLRKKFSDIYSLEPRRFEKLVADIFNNLGFRTRLTQYSKDGGVDIVLLENGTKKQILVQCKRYAKNQSVGVGVVREMLGVQLASGVPRGKIITTSNFTYAARELSRTPFLERVGVELDLVDAHRLLDALSVYNTTLPPLDLDPRFKRK